MDLSTIQSILADPRFHDYLAILKGARNGLVYGIKIRFPHALLMSILFGRGDWKARLRVIYKATKQHALSLAKFVTIYKTLVLLQKKANNGKERSADTFIAGLIGGYAVFGNRNAVNEQIVLYVCSRVVASFIPRAPASRSPSSSRPSSPADQWTDKPIPPDAQIFSVFAALSWGAVMWLFRHKGQTLQPGMWNSMVYLYRDSETWGGLRSFLLRNK